MLLFYNSVCLSVGFVVVVVSLHFGCSFCCSLLRFSFALTLWKSANGMGNRTFEQLFQHFYNLYKLRGNEIKPSAMPFSFSF